MRHGPNEGRWNGATVQPGMALNFSDGWKIAFQLAWDGSLISREQLHGAWLFRTAGALRSGIVCRGSAIA